MKPSFVAAFVISLFAASPIEAVTVEKSERYFTIHSASINAMKADLLRRGPYNAITKERTPSSSTFKFSTKFNNIPGSKSCGELNPNVIVKIQFLQPVWKPTGRSDQATQRAFDALKKDIRAFQTQQTKIAERAARELESNLKIILAGPDCTSLIERVKQEYNRHAERHDDLQTALVRNWHK